MHSCEERPGYPPTGGKSEPHSQLPCETSSPNISAWVFQKPLPVASDRTVTGRPAESQPGGDAELEEPLLQSQIRKAVFSIYLHPTSLAALF